MHLIRLIKNLCFAYLLLVTCIAVLNSDDQIGEDRLSVVYSYKIMGLDIFDYLLIILSFLSVLVVILEKKILLSKFHNTINIIVIVYAFGMIIGYLYSWFLNYSLIRWIQELQPVLYLTLIFYSAYLLINSLKKWNIFFWVLIVSTGLLNIKMLYNFIFGIGSLLDVTLLTARGLDVLLLSFMFFPLLISLFADKITLGKRFLYIVLILIYLFNIILISGRTIWAVFLFSTLFLIIKFDSKSRWKFIILIVTASVVFIMIITIFFPKFLIYAQWRLESIFDFSKTHTNLSNATRTVEIQNILYRVFDYGSPFFGMGIGAYWTDEAYSLLYGDTASGFVGIQKYYHTHFLFLNQILKIGFIGTIIFYGSMTYIYSTTVRLLKKVSDGYYFSMILALIVIFLNLIFSMLETQRFMFFLGLTIALLARIHYLNGKCITEFDK